MNTCNEKNRHSALDAGSIPFILLEIPAFQTVSKVHSFVISTGAVRQSGEIRLVVLSERK